MPFQYSSLFLQMFKKIKFNALTQQFLLQVPLKSIQIKNIIFLIQINH